MAGRLGLAIWSAAVSAVLVTAGSPAALAQERVLIDGSSTVFPITEAMAEEFQNQYRGRYQVTVGVSGTGGGFKKFCRGDIDIVDASRPIKQSEREACRDANVQFMELPVAMDAIAVVVNPENDWAQTITTEELKTIWQPEAQGEITRWSQVREGWPDQPINLYGPGVDSGTYDYFTEAVVGEEGASRGDFTASEDDNVLVQGVATDPNALGFFGLAYYTENQDKLKALAVDDGTGEPVKPSVEAARSGEYTPLSRPLFIYVKKDSADTKESVARFVDFFLDVERAPELVREVGYVPLPDRAYALAERNFDRRILGSAFGAEGSQVGMTLDDVLEAEQRVE